VCAATSAVAEVDFLQHLRQVPVQPLHLHRIGERACARRTVDLHAARAKELVGDDLHRHGEVERGIGIARRDANQQMRGLELLIGEARPLRPEEHCRRAAQRFAQHPLRRFAHVGHPEILVPRA